MLASCARWVWLPERAEELHSRARLTCAQPGFGQLRCPNITLVRTKIETSQVFNSCRCTHPPHTPFMSMFVHHPRPLAPSTCSLHRAQQDTVFPGRMVAPLGRPAHSSSLRAGWVSLRAGLRTYVGGSCPSTLAGSFPPVVAVHQPERPTTPMSLMNRSTIDS